MSDLSFLKNFTIDDFSCRCPACAANPARPHSKPDVMASTQALRDRLGKPVWISRGVSCEARNKAVGGAPDSRHLPHHADAVDIVIVDSHEGFAVVEGLMADPRWTCIRVYPKHVHADQRPGVRRFLASPE